MKLYIEDNEIYFDYQDVDTKANSNSRTDEYRQFLRESSFQWQNTLKPKCKKIAFKPRSWQTEYGNACSHYSLVDSIYSRAKYYNYIEVSDDFKPLLEQLSNECQRLREVQIAKENELKKKAEWEHLCKHGCCYCSHLKSWGDDKMCELTGDFLLEKNVPGVVKGIYQLFNYVAFPSENCPYNVNKEGEKNNERVSKTCASSSET